MGSKEDVAARIDADTQLKIEEMNIAVSQHKNSVSTYLKSKINKKQNKKSNIKPLIKFQNNLVQFS